MAQREANEEFLEKLSIPIHPSRVLIPDYAAKFGNMEIDELPINEWREYSKAKYEAMKKRFFIQKNVINFLEFYVVGGSFNFKN